MMDRARMRLDRPWSKWRRTARTSSKMMQLVRHLVQETPGRQAGPLEAMDRPAQQGSAEGHPERYNLSVVLATAASYSATT